MGDDEKTAEKARKSIESRYTTGIWTALIASLVLVILAMFFLINGDYSFGILFAILLVLDVLITWYLLRSLRKFESAIRTKTKGTSRSAKKPKR